MFTATILETTGHSNLSYAGFYMTNSCSAMSGNTMSGDTMSSDTMSGDTMSGDTMSGDTMLCGIVEKNLQLATLICLMPAFT